MRLWEVQLEVYRPFKSMPCPDIIVEEMQVGPEYRIGPRPTNRGGQFSLTLSGEGRFKSGNLEYVMLPGCGFLHNHFDADTSYWYPESSRQPWVFLWIAFHDKASEKMIAEMVKRYGCFYDLGPDGGEVHRILRSWHKWRSSVRVLSPPEGAQLMTKIFAELTDSVNSATETAPGNRLVRKAQQLIMDKVETGIRVNDIAGELKVSREHLSRIYHELTGTKLVDYIRRARINHGRGLLRQSNLSVQEVASRLGYESQAAFARAFRQIMNVSPSEYRNSISFNSSLLA
jgi:AraC-like DNA-binding protein